MRYRRASRMRYRRGRAQFRRKTGRRSGYGRMRSRTNRMRYPGKIGYRL